MIKMEKKMIKKHYKIARKQSKKIIAFDLDGTIIKSNSGERAHYDFFRVMAILLDDKSIESLAGKEGWFDDVVRIMAEYTGLNPKNKHSRKAIIRMARNIYQLLYLKAFHEFGEGAEADVINAIKKLKSRGYKIAVATATPETIVKPILESIGIIESIDIVQTQSLDEKPDKKEIMEKLCINHGTPQAYIGNSLEDYKACKLLNIPFILACWDISEEEKLDIPAEVCLETAGELIEKIKECTIDK